MLTIFFVSKKKNYISLMTYFCLLSVFYSLKLNYLHGSSILQIGMFSGSTGTSVLVLMVLIETWDLIAESYRMKSSAIVS